MFSPLKKDEIVEVLRKAPKETCTRDMLVMIEMAGSDDGSSAFNKTVEAMDDWHYWLDRGYTFWMLRIDQS